MSQDSFSIEDLLAKQQALTNLVTIEGIEGSETTIKITPFEANVGCACHLALVMPRMSVESVTSTGEYHSCCGRSLMVVAVKFRDDTLADVFRQLTIKVRTMPSQNQPGNPEALRSYPRERHPGQSGRLSSQDFMIPERGRRSLTRQAGVQDWDCVINCMDEYQQCYSYARNGEERCFCGNYLRACYGSCGGRRSPFVWCEGGEV